MKRIIIFILLMTLPIFAYGATRDVVPRADEEGSIGTAAKQWGDGRFGALTITGTGTFDALTLGADENITLGTDTFKFDSGTDDFILSDDLNIQGGADGAPHVKWDDDQDDFEIYADGSQLYLTNVTDSKEYLRINESNLLQLYNQIGFSFPDGAPSDNQILKYDVALGRLAWEADAGGAGVAYWQYTLLPESAILDDNNPPAVTVIESTGTGTPRFRVADFDATTDEIIYWTFIVPDDMAAGDWLADVSWYANDIGADEDACFGIAISATTEGDADTMAEQAISTIDYACEDCNATEVNRLVQTTITISDLDSVAAGDVITLQFRRDADNTNGAAGGDGLTSDARLVGVRLRIPRS